MVLSIARARLRADARPQSPPPALSRPEPVADRDGGDHAGGARGWATERGTIRWEAVVDVAGGFPGHAAHGGRLDGASFRVTDRFLLIEEGRPHGFGLPIGCLADAGADPGSNRAAEPVLRLTYRDGDLRRAFAVRFRGTLLAPRGARRAERALAALQAVGVPRRAGDTAGSSLAMPWGETGPFHGENVIWSGRATAPIGGGLDRAPADVWLTTRSLIWGGAPGDGVCRLPLERVLDVLPTQLGDRAGTPATYVAFAGADGTRHDVTFVFDAHAHDDRNQRERGAFLVGLRSRGVPLGVGAPARQPWRLDVRPAMPLVPVPHHPDPPGKGAVGTGAAEIVPFPVPAEVLVAPVVGDGVDRPVATGVGGWPPSIVGVDVGGADGDGARVRLFTQNGPPTLGRPTTPPTPAPPVLTVGGVLPAVAPPVPVAAVVQGNPGTATDSDFSGWSIAAPALPLARSVEAAALAAVAEVARAIGAVGTDQGAGPSTTLHHIPPPADRQHAALAALDAAVAGGEITAAEGGIRRARLLALAEATPRLRGLLERRLAGHLAADDLARSRGAILAPLARQVFGADG